VTYPHELSADHAVASDASRAARPKGTRITALALVVSAGALIATGLFPFATGLLGAVVLYEISARPYEWLARRIKRPLAAALTVGLIVVLVAIPAVWLTSRLVGRVPAALSWLSSLSLQRLGPPATGVLAKLAPHAAQATEAAGSWVARQLISVGSGFAWGLVNWSISLLGLYFLLGSAPTAWQRLASLLPISAAGAETLRVRLRDTTQGMVAGPLLSAAVQGAVIGLGLHLAGVPEAMFWSVVAAITTLIPIAGNFLVSGPAILVMILLGRYESALIIALFSGPFPPVIDRVVRGSIGRRLGSVHPMITMVGALAGIRVAGMAGIVLGPLLIAMFFALLDVYTQEYVAPEANPSA
jgi:predicted PurR-regulated permease PerM